MPVAPPPPRSLSLTALRAFEAAARLGGFTAAAQELGVTAGAVTAQIKGLEAEIGAPLFERTARGVQLTTLGLSHAAHFTRAFDALAQASAGLRAQAAPQVVHIATLPALAHLWLSPRLPALRAIAPEISISITALEAPPNLKRAPYDLSLFPAQSGGTLVAEDWLIPVCSPSFAKQLTCVEDLAKVPCLSDSIWDEDWQIWLKYQGFDLEVRGPVFSLYALAMAEAVNGAGVLIGHGPLVRAELGRGTLVAPFSQKVTLKAGLRLWAARPLHRGSAISQVYDFLCEGRL